LGIVGETLLDRGGGDFLELGGNGLFILNLDYRFPIAGPLGGTVFFDLGNVWADWRDLDPSDLEAGAGLGLRYRSPIGPVRISVGWKIDSQLRRSDKPVFFLSFGNPF
jgi:outer membrane translocation and assembly module TamA